MNRGYLMKKGEFYPTQSKADGATQKGKLDKKKKDKKGAKNDKKQV